MLSIQYLSLRALGDSPPIPLSSHSYRLLCLLHYLCRSFMWLPKIRIRPLKFSGKLSWDYSRILDLVLTTEENLKMQTLQAISVFSRLPVPDSRLQCMIGLQGGLRHLPTCHWADVMRAQPLLNWSPASRTMSCKYLQKAYECYPTASIRVGKKTIAESCLALGAYLSYVYPSPAVTGSCMISCRARYVSY